MALVVKNLPINAGDDMWVQSLGQENPRVRKIPWRRAWQLTPVVLPGEAHRQRSLEGYSPWGHIELDMTEVIEHTRQWTCHVAFPKE